MNTNINASSFSSFSIVIVLSALLASAGCTAATSSAPSAGPGGDLVGPADGVFAVRAQRTLLEHQDVGPRGGTATCVDAPGYNLCNADAQDLFESLPASTEQRDLYFGITIRHGRYQSAEITCTGPLDDESPQEYGCHISRMLDHNASTQFLIDLWNLPGSVMHGSLHRFEFRTWPDNRPTGIYGAYLSRTMGPYRCQARVAFVGHTWNVDFSKTYAPSCEVTLRTAAH